MPERLLIPSAATAPAPLAAGAVHCRLAGQSMGTSWSLQLMLAPHGPSQHQVLQAVQAQLELVIAQMSTWQPDSLLSRYNQGAAGSWHALPPPLLCVLEAALTMAADSDGAFDPTVGPLVDLWGFGPGPGRGDDLPTAAQVRQARARCGWRRIQLDRAARRVLQAGDACLDLSGIAKGYAVDLVAQALEVLGCTSYLVEIGGELRGLGIKPDGHPWYVQLERPPGRAGDALLLALHGLAVATSGDYRRCFEHQGRRYAHTIDPRSGEPLRQPPVSVTVLHRQCMVADALATALTVLGVQQGLAFARRRNIAAVFLHEGAHGLQERMTPALAAMLD
ncbi:FAD:protein FMN transferase [Herbaspirillum sp. YR522]|uniref:FAD:protein FMN transferase n=1 Tax=Herbaspirillum sp. YR522 TaxID=1144342 RepID=UPI00026FB377|nr:FAD:protein FMN transferase [Herbaspirillum sp. YR522]EJN06166.1 membrane-associated lipoprotein involved in thiamine biosynthesis [Herbaspirillum sp. YR522]